MATIAGDITVQFPGNLAIAGDLIHDYYADGTPALLLLTEEGREVLSVNLVGHGMTPRAGCVFISDGFPNTGVADSLVESGLVTKVNKVTFGPFDASAWEVAINKEIDLSEVLGSGKDLEIVYDEVLAALYKAHPIFTAAYNDDEGLYGDLPYAITDLDDRGEQSVADLREAVEGYLSSAAEPFGITILT